MEISLDAKAYCGNARFACAGFRAVTSGPIAVAYDPVFQD